MTYRKHLIFPEQIYHVYNRGIALEPIFKEKKDYLRFIEVVNFYRYSSPGLRFSYYNRLPIDQRTPFIEDLEKNGEKQVIIYAFTLMPNHFHFLLKGTIEYGIQKFFSNLQNSYAKYFNTKTKRTGSLFQEMFKAVRIESDEQFIHTTRYVHLNPSTSYLVKNINELKKYPWSSLKNYIGNDGFNFVETDFLNSFYNSKEKLMSFTFDQIDYQRKLEEIKHLILEAPVHNYQGVQSYITPRV